LDGIRYGSNSLYHFDQYPQKFICPINFLWKPETKTANNNRKIWIWVHPSSFQEVFNSLDLLRQSNEEYQNLTLLSLENELLKFDLIGPRSQAILHHIFHVCQQDKKKLEVKSNQALIVFLFKNNNKSNSKLWETLSFARSSSCLPYDIVLGLEIYDPRLKYIIIFRIFFFSLNLFLS